MIFNSNTTSLGNITLPVVEGYDCSTGVAKALIESARNDYSMFKAMLELDARELSINNESAGYVNEAEISALQEAAAGGILSKIVEMLKSLGAKIKSIFDNFIARLTGLFAKDKDLVKKYKTQVLKKGSKINKMEVTFFSDKDTADIALAMNGTLFTDLFKELEITSTSSVDTLASFYNDEKEEIEKGIFNRTFEDMDNEHKEDIETEKKELKDFGIDIIKIINFMENSGKMINELTKAKNKLDTDIKGLIKNVDKERNSVVKSATTDEPKTDEITKYNNAYSVALVYQEGVLKLANQIINIYKTCCKLTKAIFMKAVTINPNKIEESSIYADAIAEAAQNEVEDVISGAISSEELSDTCNASLNVKDADVSDDPDKLTYGPDKYTDDAVCVPTDGSIDSNIIGKVDAKKEAAMFGTLLY